ncbi:MAG: PAS domain S-box protein, partial [Gallionella sp.]
MLLIVLVMMLAYWQINRDIVVDREVPLTAALSTYSSKLEGDTLKSRTMGAAILFGLEDFNAKELALGKLPPDAPQVSSALDILRKLYFSETVYLVNQRGVVAASSSQGDTSGTGFDLSDRSFVKTAMRGIPNIYPGMDNITNNRCIFIAAPIRTELNENSKVIGVIVLKAGADKVDALLESWTGGPAMLLSPQGVIFAASRKDWIFHTTADANKESIDRIRRTQQFGNIFDQVPPPSLPFTLDKPETNIDGVTHIVRSRSLLWQDPAGNWTLVLLDRGDPWWTQWRVLALAVLAGLVSALVLFWLRTIARNELLQHAIYHERAIAAATFESNEGIMITDTNRVILKVNHSFTEITGYASEEAVGKTPAMLASGRHDKEFYRHMWEALEREKSWRGEIWNERKNGEPYPAWLTITVVKREDGKVAYYVATYTDITERKKSENMLRVAAATFETHDAIMITDARANIIRVNQAFQDITGYSSEEVLGKNPRILSSGRQDKAFYEAMWKQLLENGSWTGEIWDRRKSGQIYPKMLTITAVKNDRQETTQYVGIFSDITERKKEEEALLLKSGTIQRRAEELTQELGYLLKNSFNEIYLFDADSLHFLLTSEGAENNLGYSSDELKQFTPLDLCPSITKENFSQMLALLSSGEQQSLFFETVLHRKNGTTYPVEVRLQFINLDTPVFMFIIQDITEHKSAERQLRNLSMHIQTVREEEKAS